ncbi:hypothetical protein [Pseudoxanthomonas sp. SE1]|uniref:hypothetical protein n=1 Tax=Pseudoxanthomonas sp. SE1 TaxID=1664560 RepID=UPI00240E887E|nr:hypothetical protein [Pseudoxanthomonas sp. SE1]WFC40276.1 hypothetical protein OY559_10465 [Pseudoxanthomonas sp. SE1]WFC43721.1 hypothetical protein OY559_09585 [Pseudoxanthomonas sp. SE1]
MFRSTLQAACVSMALSALGSASTAMAGEMPRAAANAFYEVPLRCPSAPQIACGGKVKPVLRALENQPSVAEAWVDRTGTIVAAVWKSGSDSVQRDAAVEEVASIHDLRFRRLGGSRARALQESFQTRDGWYNKMTADELSNDEARFIAQRLTRRLVAHAPSAASKAATVVDAIEPQLRQDLVGQSVGTRSERLIGAVSPLLDENELRAFADALKLGTRPLKGEE